MVDSIPSRLASFYALKHWFVPFDRPYVEVLWRLKHCYKLTESIEITCQYFVLFYQTLKRHLFFVISKSRFKISYCMYQAKSHISDITNWIVRLIQAYQKAAQLYNCILCECTSCIQVVHKCSIQVVHTCILCTYWLTEEL